MRSIQWRHVQKIHSVFAERHSMRSLFYLLVLPALFLPKPPARQDIVVADFEGRNYGDWKTTGTAFGPAPAQGTLPGQMPVSGYRGHGLVNSYFGGDSAAGTLTSPKFVLTRRYLNFLIGGGKHAGKTCINLLVNGKIVRTATGPNGIPGGSERLAWATWDIANLQGKTAHLEIIDRATEGWGHINVDDITLSDTRQADAIKTGPLYNETYRPQFHFTAQTGWLNDPNGMVYCDGEYHLFFQHNPFGLTSGNLTWGHAVSRDMVHWKQAANAITPDERGPIWSGSAVVDWHNTTGLAHGTEKPLVALYTAAGGTSPESQGQPFTQCLVYSLDKGRTWTKYAQNPVMQHIIGGNRDPKVIWFEPTRRWIMALYLDKEDFGLYASPDLKTWTALQTFTMPGSSECPDFFPLPIEGEPGQTRWIFTGANGRYCVGTFDGAKFTPEEGPFPADYGANYYAVQTFSDIPAQDGRRIQIAWMMGGNYPEMPFNQQMSFPCELTLHRTPEGLRLYRRPVREIAALHEHTHTWHNLTLKPGDNPLHGLSGTLWDIEAEFEIQDAAAFGLRVRGEDIRYAVAEQTVTCLNKTAPLKSINHRVTLRLLADRTSLEVFGNGGQVALTSCFLPRAKEQGLTVYTEGGSVKLVALTVHSLRSAWQAAH